jgi:hypothetical protein
VGLRGDRCAYVADNPAKDFVSPHRLGSWTVRVRRLGSLHTNAPSGGDIDAEITSLDDLDTALAWDDCPTSNHTTNDFRRGIAPSEQNREENAGGGGGDDPDRQRRRRGRAGRSPWPT